MKKLYATTTSTEDHPGISLHLIGTQMQEIEATCEALNRYTSEWCKTPFWRFGKRKKLIWFIDEASKHLEKVLHEYNYEK